jgi:hypothetical protein
MTIGSFPQKCLTTVIMLCATVCGISTGSAKAQASWSLKNDSMNLGILVLDYQTYAFEKGALSIHPPCDKEDADSLPFTIKYNPPYDFGDISFFYSLNQERLFYATIVWMGQGSITWPDFFLPADSFETQKSDIVPPLSVQYFSFGQPILLQQADSVWNAVKSLSVVKDFSRQPYRVGIYLYPPSVGAFQPSVAKWIIFLYRGKPPTTIRQSVVSGQYSPLFSIEKFSGARLSVTFSTEHTAKAVVAIFSAQGRKIAEVHYRNLEPGNHAAEINTSRWANGVYLCKVSIGDRSTSQQIVIAR